jgi:UDP-3-O-[3-hydroxymyristoyl] glucosamine N-acyltransferase
MPTTLASLAHLVGGELVGDGSLEITGAATLLDAKAGDVTLVDRNEKAGVLASARASAAIVPRGFPLESLTMPAVVVADVHQAFTLLVLHFRPPRPEQRIGISPQAIVSPSARIADDVDVHAGATIGSDVTIGPGSTIYPGARIMAGCKLGRNVTVHPNAVLYERTVVGENSAIHANVVIGAHGFGYRMLDGANRPAAQLGWVEIGRDCEIGACSTVDRGTYGPTIIGDGTKLDNLVMIAHNCRIGRHNMICSQVGVAGSTTTGDYVVMAGQVGVRDHVHIGERAILAAKAGVSSDVPAGAHMLGTPAIREREQKIQFAAMSKLPEMRRQLKRLQRIVDELVGPDQTAEVESVQAKDAA